MLASKKTLRYNECEIISFNYTEPITGPNLANIHGLANKGKIVIGVTSRDFFLAVTFVFRVRAAPDCHARYKYKYSSLQQIIIAKHADKWLGEA